MTEKEIGQLVWEALSKFNGRRITPEMKKLISYEISKQLKDSS